MPNDNMPTTEEMREYFAMGPYQPWAKAPMSDDARAAMFDRWLADHDAEVARMAWLAMTAVRSELERILRGAGDRP